MADDDDISPDQMLHANYGDRPMISTASANRAVDPEPGFWGDIKRSFGPGGDKDLLGAYQRQGEREAEAWAARKHALASWMREHLPWPINPGPPNPHAPEGLEQAMDLPLMGGVMEGPVRPTGRAAISSIRGGSPEEALEAAKAGTHLKQMPGGKYAGAPANIDSPQALAAMRRKILADAIEGAEGGDWYHRARNDISQMTGNDPEKVKLASHELAATSPQAEPEVNLGFALQGHNAAIAGQPRQITHTGAIADIINDAVLRNNFRGLGNKTDVYEQNVNPLKPEAGGTNDTWHARAFGYTNPGTNQPWSGSVAGAMHPFMDNETILLADRLNKMNAAGRNNWTPAEVQAAIWVRNKALGIIDKYERLGWKPITYDQAFAMANETYGESFPKHTAYATHEAAPYAGSEHLPGFADLPEEVKQAYANAAPWSTAPGGRDALYNASGMYVLPTHRNAQGFYQGPHGPEYTPVDVARPLVDFDPGKTGPEIPQSTKDILNAVEGVRGTVGVQGGSPWSKPVYGTKPGAATALMEPRGGPMTREEIANANTQAAPHGLTAIDTGEGALRFDPSGKATPKFIAAASKSGLPGQRVGLEGPEGYFDLSEELQPENAGKGLATDKMLAKLEKLYPPMQERITNDPHVLQTIRNMAERDRLLAEKHGLQQRYDIQNLREAMSQPGWAERLRGLRKAGIALPGISVAPAFIHGKPEDEQ